MKTPTWLRAAACGLILAGATTIASAQNTNPTNSFDTAASTASFKLWWGTTTMTWDGSLDAANDPLSGSVQYVAPFVGAAGEQFMTFFTIANRWQWDGGYILDATTYTNMSFDIKVDPTSAITSGGNYGYLEVGFTSDGWGTTTTKGFNVPLSATNWTHIDCPLTASMANIDKVNGYFIKMWSNGAHTNSLIFNIDNIMYTKPTAPVVILPPTVSLNSAGKPGLQVILGASNSQWQRDALVTPADATCMWAGNGATPVTYSFNVTDFPEPVAHEGFEAHMFLVNRDTTDAFNETYGGCDWNVPDLVRMMVTAQANGTYLAHVDWKTNLPNANPPVDTTHTPATLSSPTALGTWSLSFTHDTNVTFSGPGGISTNFTIPIEAVQNNFSPAASYIQFGFHKNDNENNGHNDGTVGVFGRVTKTGGTTVFDETFTGTSLTNTYAWRRTSSTWVQYVAPGVAWDLVYTLPANGFFPQVAGSVTGPFSSLPTVGSYQVVDKVHNYIHTSALPAGPTAFFRMIKRPFSQLQVLLPGESNAPDTVTGKTGTPDAQLLGVPFNITINAVDATWRKVSSTDVVAISSTDVTAIDGMGNPLPQNVNLLAGSATFGVVLNASGTWTLTATDTTDGTKTPNTSTPVVIP